MSEFPGSASDLPEGPADWDLNELHKLSGKSEESLPEEIGAPEFIDVVMIAEKLIKEAEEKIEKAKKLPLFEQDKDQMIREAMRDIRVAKAMIKHAQTLAEKN